MKEFLSGLFKCFPVFSAFFKVTVLAFYNWACLCHSQAILLIYVKKVQELIDYMLFSNFEAQTWPTPRSTTLCIPQIPRQLQRPV